ncbi:hypothetical protein [Methylobacterium oxalidis]|uniref:Lipoprotein n=1 Tax=Methylobacterium oxalidis TaxID=944322 RepID=A0A512IYR5_9HYPH|nr:hypothetical protein [Methylobacterium oxalidis]GEP02858.1 hypothetical protein MOX02_08960 [Methylobacterium oxalidis]GJE32661.1 hypothetical protein LDDCCGHA_2849 [Methylobacterium oxalidis]GLS66741.1 hypothetical protein GCM10007888_51240 [Methylobacterium oxalidis]
MAVRGRAAARRAARAAGLLLLGCAGAGAADLLGDAPPGPPVARYFPRGDGSEERIVLVRPGPRPVGCLPRRVPVPTNAPDDPSYVGSAYGLSRPSYYGLTPPPGIDDPYGRPLLPYCR